MNNDKVKKILEAPDNLEPLFIDPQLSGFSGKKIVALLQNLVSCLDPQNEVYLEVGVFKGLSLLSVSKVFNGSTFGIDNFSQFDPEKKNVNLIMEQCARLGINNSNLINSDLEIAFKNLNEHLDGKKIGLYFIDGPHDYRSQFLCLLLAQPFLSDNAVIVIDDSNYRHVRQANDDFLSVAQTYKLAFEKYTKAHPHNMDADERTHAMENWWNGINVLVNDRNNTWQQKKINTIDSRLLYYNDQYIHSAKYADCAPEAIKVANALRPFRPIKLIARLINLYKNVKKSDSLYAGKFKYLNTYTDEMV